MNTLNSQLESGCILCEKRIYYLLIIRYLFFTIGFVYVCIYNALYIYTYLLFPTTNILFSLCQSTFRKSLIFSLPAFLPPFSILYSKSNRLCILKKSLRVLSQTRKVESNPSSLLSFCTILSFLLLFFQLNMY